MSEYTETYGAQPTCQHSHATLLSQNAKLREALIDIVIKLDSAPDSDSALSDPIRAVAIDIAKAALIDDMGPTP